MELYTPEQARKLRDITQKEMAHILGMCENAYILKEKGLRRFYVDEAIAFARAVDLPLDRIIFLPN